LVPILTSYSRTLVSNHRSGGNGAIVIGSTADDPTHGWIAHEAGRVVYAIVPEKMPKHGMTQRAAQDVPYVLATMAV
jgi:hypothetical protein